MLINHSGAPDPLDVMPPARRDATEKLRLSGGEYGAGLRYWRLYRNREDIQGLVKRGEHDPRATVEISALLLDCGRISIDYWANKNPACVSACDRKISTT